MPTGDEQARLVAALAHAAEPVVVVATAFVANPSESAKKLLLLLLEPVNLRFTVLFFSLHLAECLLCLLELCG